MEPDLLQLVYAPASYYRPWRAVYAQATPAQQRWLNATLIRQRDLPVPSARAHTRAPLARQLALLYDGALAQIMFQRSPEAAQIAGHCADSLLRGHLPP